jgi:hypothetical protein
MFEGFSSPVSYFYGRLGAVVSGGAMYPAWYAGLTTTNPLSFYGTWNIAPVTISAATNLYWQVTSTQPTNSTDLGKQYQITITPRDGTSVWYNAYHAASSKWYRVAMQEFTP